MDQESKKTFDELSSLQPHELRETDVEFLRAREAYLSDEQKKRFAPVLHPEPEKPAKKKSDVE